MPFDANNVPIQITFTLPQVNLLLKGLGKLPFEEVEQIYLGIRQLALHELKKAEDAFNAPQPEPEVLPHPDTETSAGNEGL